MLVRANKKLKSFFFIKCVNMLNECRCVSEGLKKYLNKYMLQKYTK